MQIFKSSETWVVDFLYEGRARRWFKIFRVGEPVYDRMAQLLKENYGEKARLASARRATEPEEKAYLRGQEIRDVLCPTGRFPNGNDPLS